MSLAAFVARIGTNMQFVAFNAHWGVTYALLSMLAHAIPTASIWPGALVVLIAAAVKEFWFDATYESPKQSFADNLEDFAGYAAGVAAFALVRA